MNILETYVSNITLEEKCEFEDFTCYRLIADTDCYGSKTKNKEFIVSEDAYKMIKEKGYYLT